MKLFVLILSILTLTHAPEAPEYPDNMQAYSAFSETGVHLVMSDNGTPDDPDDDFVVDWEDNRAFTLTIYD